LISLSSLKIIFSRILEINENDVFPFLLFEVAREDRLLISQNGRALETSLDIDRMRSDWLREDGLREGFSQAFISHVRRVLRENFVLLR